MGAPVLRRVAILAALRVQIVQLCELVKKLTKQEIPETPHALLT